MADALAALPSSVGDLDRIVQPLDDAGIDGAAAPGEPDLSMPAEAFVRLVYGRLDPDHAPAGVEGDERLLEQLRAVFPGP
jgi:hypothetical protein